MNWLDKQVSLYKCPADNIGRLVTFRDILFTEFAVDHEWYYRNPAHYSDPTRPKWISGVFNDLETIIDLRTREMTPDEKTILKQTLQCYTPGGSFKSKKKGFIELLRRTGLMQLDFDYKDIKHYDIEELMQAVFSLPFVAFVGRSCTGKGFYALILIAEPEKLAEYAEHCFMILESYGIPADTSKGRNVNDLRFVSYDANMLIRENPETLQVKNFLKKQAPVVKMDSSKKPPINSTGLIGYYLKMLQSCEVGNRWATVQRVAYTLGGIGSGLDQIKDAINNLSQFTGQEAKYIECAEVCFKEGSYKPLIVSA